MDQATWSQQYGPLLQASRSAGVTVDPYQQASIGGGMAGPDPSYRAKFNSYWSTPEGQKQKELYQLGLQNGWIKPNSSDGGLMGFMDRAVPLAVQGITMAGIGAGLGGIAGIGPAAGGGGSAVGGGAGGGGMAVMPGAEAAASGATGGILSGGAAVPAASTGMLAGSMPAAMPYTGAAGNAAGVGVGGSALGASTAGGGLMNAAAGGAASTATGGMGGVLNSILPAAGQAAGATAATTLLGSLGQTGLDLYTSQQRQDAANRAAQLADPFASQRPMYQKQLADLMNNPSSFAQNPAYQFAVKQGQNALERSDVAKGQLGSGNILHDLQNYGQQSAYQGLQGQQNLLAGLAGGNLSQGYAGNVYGTGTTGAIGQQYQGLSQLGNLIPSLFNYGNSGGSQVPVNNAVGGSNNQVSLI